jgi:predicted GIY-YIG superfamily endonuclease
MNFGIIYGIYYNNECLYIGSTKNLKKRKRDHKSDCYNLKGNRYTRKIYHYIRENVNDWNELEWKIYESVSYENKKSLLSIEAEYIKYFNPIGNCEIPGREYKESQQQYYQNNLDKIKEQRKQYRQNNLDKIKEKHKQYYQNNSDKIKEKIHCQICDCYISKNNFSRHEKTKSHQLNLLKINNI